MKLPTVSIFFLVVSALIGQSAGEFSLLKKTFRGMSLAAQTPTQAQTAQTAAPVAPSPAAATVAPVAASVAAVTAPSKVPAVQHSKEAGNGYLPGSPLYEEQEAKKQKEVKQRAFTEARPIGGLNSTELGNATSYGEYHALALNNPLYVFCALLLQLLFVCVLGFLYLKFVRTNKLDSELKAMDYNNKDFPGLCDTSKCCKDLVCFTAWCCPLFRIADTASTRGINIMSFWVTLILLTVLYLLNVLTGGACGLVMLVIVVYMRQQLRAKFGLENGGASWGKDCLLWCCCSPCVIAQEARQAEDFKPVNPQK